MKIIKPCVSCLAAILACCWVTQAMAQSEATPHERLDFDIKYLASDELEGREPGTKGIELAADYIIDTWKEFGVPGGAKDGSYRQDFEVNMGTVTDKEKTGLKFNLGSDDSIEAKIEEHFQPMMSGGNGSFKDAPLVFAGYGISAKDENYDDFKDLDCEGKVVVVIRMEPQQKNPNSVFAGTDNSSHASISRKLQLAQDAGAVAMILVNDGDRVADSGTDELAQPSQFGRVDDTIPFFHVKREVMDQLLAKAPLTSPPGEKLETLDAIEAVIDENLEPISQTLEGITVNGDTLFSRKNVTTSNIVGVIEGEGPNADETIVIGGHYDHLGYGGYGSNAPGRREVHNGADDNATGTAGLVELARRFANADKKPGRRLVFIAFSGEERGLLGSFHYVEEPLYPLDKTVAMINYDMIGRLRDDKLTLFGAGTGDNFSEICDAANTDGLDLNKVPSASAGSDHMAFVRREIPVMFLHTGLTNIYHTPEDDYETLNIEGANRVVDYTERLLWGLANAEAKPNFVQVDSGRRRARRPSYFGVRLDYEADERGPRIEEAPEDAPAATAGLKAGDVILTIAGEEVTDAAELTAVLTKNRPGTTIEVVVMRGDKEMTMEVELARTPRRSRNSDKSGDSKGNPESKSNDNKKKG